MLNEIDDSRPHSSKELWGFFVSRKKYSIKFVCSKKLMLNDNKPRR